MRGSTTGCGVAGQPDLLEPLGQPAERDVVDAELVQRALGRGDLRRAAVDDDEVRRVGELARPAGLRVDAGRAPPAAVDAGAVGRRPRGRRSGPARRRSRRNRRLITSWIEATSPPAPGRSRLAPDDEAAVLALAGQAVLEDHHRRDDLALLQVRDVEALDAQRRLVEPERLLDLLQREAARGQVAAAPGLVQRERLLGVARDGLHQRPLVAALRHPQVDPAAAQAGQPVA